MKLQEKADSFSLDYHPLKTTTADLFNKAIDEHIRLCMHQDIYETLLLQQYTFLNRCYVCLLLWSDYIYIVPLRTDICYLHRCERVHIEYDHPGSAFVPAGPGVAICVHVFASTKFPVG